MKEWLVSIESKAYSHLGRKVICYIEVLAEDEYYARHKGFAEFERIKAHRPIMRRRLEALDLPIELCCAAEAIELD